MPPGRPAVRFLLDEHIPEGIALVLRGLRQDAEHVSALGLSGADDTDVAERAKDFDVFLTLDLHRQEREFFAVSRHLIEGGFKVLRLRLPRQPDIDVDYNILLAQQLIHKMPEWLEGFEEGAVLITLGPRLGRLSASTSADVASFVSARRPR